MNWVTTVGGDSCDFSLCITTDTVGNVYIGGYFISDSIRFGNITLYNSHPGISLGYPSTGCSNLFIAKLSDSNSGITSIKNEEEIIIYPNPTSSTFYLKLPENTKFVRIYNSLGQPIKPWF